MNSICIVISALYGRRLIPRDPVEGIFLYVDLCFLSSFVTVLIIVIKIIVINEKKNCFFMYDQYASSSITGLVFRRAPMSG